MEDKNPYGSLSAESFRLGDIVEWSIWDALEEKFVSHYGVITEIKNKFISNRLVSICTTVPLESSYKEIELFSLSLKLVSPAGGQDNKVVS
tara:strand:+ start:627 stop:899 length:273 start_codon:yes stop_codon:yes gene_type:complete